MLNSNLRTKFGNPAPATQRCDGNKFYSYGSLIAYAKDGKIHFTKYWNYSNTTTVYLKSALNVQSVAEIHKGIKDGKYIID